MRTYVIQEISDSTSFTTLYKIKAESLASAEEIATEKFGENNYRVKELRSIKKLK